MTSRWVPRTKIERNKLREKTTVFAAKKVILKCGHETTAQPIVTGAKTLYSCPAGCGLIAKGRP